MKIFSFILLSTLCMPSAHAFSCASAVKSDDVSDPYIFATAYVDAFEHIRAARAESLTLGHIEAPSDLFVKLNDMDNQAGCAFDTLARYEKSPNQSMSTTAKGMGITATELQLSIRAIAANAKDRFNGVAEKAGDHAEKMAKIQGDTTDAWNNLLPTSSAAMFSFIEFSPDEKGRRLSLTTKQRAEIADRINKGFPLRAKVNADKSIDPVDGSIEMVYDVMTTKNWASHDQPYRYQGSSSK